VNDLANPPLWKRLWCEIIRDPLRQVDRENRDYLASPQSRGADWKVMTVLVVTAISLTLQEYLGASNHADRVPRWLQFLGLHELSSTSLQWLQHPANGPLVRLGYWSLACLTCYFVLPALAVRFVFRQRLRDFGIALTRDSLRHWWLYAIMLVGMAVVVSLASLSPEFQAAYPLYRESRYLPLWPYYACWVAIYGLQFFAIEFFFRGFIVHGLKQRFGVYGIFVMMVPYCMIHFQKPMLESFAAIIAGIALGFLSLTTRSIWLGTLLHVSVGVGMDLAALYRHGCFS